MTKTIIITGSTQGLGLQLGLYLLKKGNYIVFNYGHDDKQANIARKKIENINNNRFQIIKADLSTYEETNKFFNRIKKTVGNVDILINNIGIARSGNILFLKKDLWHETILTNLDSVYYCTKCFSKMEKESNNKNKIINIGSSLAFVGKMHEVAYSTSKAALIGFTKTIALDLSIFGIKVYLIFPPSIHSNLNKNGQRNYTLINNYCSFIDSLCNDIFEFPSGSIINLNNKFKGGCNNVYTFFNEEDVGK